MSAQALAGVLGLGTLGGLWAAAVGTKRIQRPARTAMLDARTQLQVRLDALRARAALVRRADLPDDAAGLVDDVVEQLVLIDAVLARAASATDVLDLSPEVELALEHLEEAGASIGLHLPANEPFHGLCANDPAHGATADGESVCVACAEAERGGATRAPRPVSVGGRPVPFDQV